MKVRTATTTLDTERSAVVPEPSFTPSMDRDYDKTVWLTPGIFSRLGLEIIRPEHKVFNLDVSA